MAPLLALVLPCVAQNSAIKADSSPIAKVVTLITEMKATTEKEAAADQDAYDKYSCWSQTNEKEKRASIKSNTENVETQEAFVEEAAGTSAKLSTEIKGLASDIEEAQASLDSANEQREKESEEFQAEEADMKETIDLLGQALTKLQQVQLLQKHGKTVPKHTEAEVLLQVRQVVKQVRRRPQFNSLMQRDLYDVLGSLEQVARKEAYRQGSTLEVGHMLGEVFLPKKDGPSLFQNLLDEEAKPNNLKGGSAGAKSYNSRSGPIFGILGEMKDEFMRDLSSAQKADFTAEVNFQNLNAAKTGEMAAATKQKEMKEGQLADLQAKVANAKESIESSNAAIDSDTKFLNNLLKNTKKEDEEYAARVKTRSDEIKALGATLEILTDEDSRTLFSKTISFLQTGASAAARVRAQERASKRAMQKLMGVGRKHKNMALVGLAVRIRLDAFTKVKASLAKMLGVLKDQQKAEYAKWEECKKEIDETEDEIKEASETQKDLAEKKQDLVNTLSELKTGIDELNSEVKSMEVELKKAGEARKAENLLYQTSISDQRATVAILSQALEKLKAFYNKASFVQIQSKTAQPATDDYEKNAGAGGVMQLMAKIITDAETEAQELAMGESDAQASYAEFVQDTTNSIEVSRKAIAEKEKQSAAAKSEKSETEGSMIANKGEIEKLEKLLQGTHASCDFLIKYFDARQKARQEEMDSIGEATAILSGANFQ